MVAEPANLEEAVTLACKAELSQLQSKINADMWTDALTEKLKAINIDPIKEVCNDSNGQQGSAKEKEARSHNLIRKLKDTGSGSFDKGKDSVSTSQKSIKCYNCNNFGHIKRECRAPKYDISTSSSVDKKVVAVTFESVKVLKVIKKIIIK